jgi:hypothetical protein
VTNSDPSLARALRCRSLATFKGKLKAATQGHSMLKKKSDALNAKLRKILVQLRDVWRVVTFTEWPQPSMMRVLRRR